MWLQPLGRLELLGTKFTPAKLEGGAGHNGIVQHALSQLMSCQLHILTWVSFISHEEISSSTFPTLLAKEETLPCIFFK